VRPETAISLALLALFQERGTDVGFRKDVIGVIKKLRSKDIEISGIRIRPGVEGEYSDEDSDFVGRLAIAGYVVQESPIRLTEQGVRLITSHVKENIDNPQVAKSLQLLRIPSTRLERSQMAQA